MAKRKLFKGIKNKMEHQAETYPSFFSLYAI